MKFPKLMTLPQRAIRRLFFRGGASYYSPDVWEKLWAGGFDLNNSIEDGRYGTLLALLRRYERRGPILDAGCGDGLFEQIFRPFSNVRLVGIDYAPLAIEKAQGRHLANCEFFCQDYREFRPEERYSVILLNESLYYIKDYRDLLKSLCGHLADGGVFIISMWDKPVSASIWKALKKDFAILQGIFLRDEASGIGWWIRVLQPRAKIASPP
jgi:trans-aconitate methyltransferase